MSEEIFDIVNERDEVVGQNTRREVHARGLWHRAVHMLVFNSRGEIFLQKRSMKRTSPPANGIRRRPAIWTAARITTRARCARCARRLGLEIKLPLQKLFKIDARKETGWEFCWIYRCESEGPFVLHPDEIETGAWFAPEAVTKWVNEKPQDFASAFVLIWKTFVKSLKC